LSTNVEAKENPDDTSNRVYDELKEKNKRDFDNFFDDSSKTSNEGNVDQVDNFIQKVWNIFSAFYRIIKSIFPLALISTMSLGVIIMIIARKNKKIQKFALYSFIIGLPLVYLGMVFGIPYLKYIVK
jgi:hypothetical protein